jgi:hypothetical protein
MEAVLVVFAIFFFVIAGLSSVFLTLIQPLWAIIDIAVSEKISQGAKIFLLIVILAGIPICIITVFGIIFIPFIALIPFIYGFFFTASTALRKMTRISFVFLVCASIGIAATAFLSSKVRENIEHYRDMKWKTHRISLLSEQAAKNPLIMLSFRF